MTVSKAIAKRMDASNSSQAFARRLGMSGEMAGSAKLMQTVNGRVRMKKAGKPAFQYQRLEPWIVNDGIVQKLNPP
jgi:hypothetical protein